MRFLRSDPVAQMPDPDAMPAADRDESPARQPVPRPPVRLAKTPHCNGRHGVKEGLTRCEWCDALTDVITAVRRLERDVAELRAASERRTP